MNLYRYDDMVYSTCSISVSGCETYGTTPVQLELREYSVIKETKCGWWISYAFGKKWVAKGGGKRFAYHSISLALESFIIRKNRQIGIFETRLSRARTALAMAEQERSKQAA